MWAKLWKNAIPRNVEEKFKIFFDPYGVADDFQNLTISSLSLDTSVVQF